MAETMDAQESDLYVGDYPTNEWGDPDGKNYHYRIHLNDRSGMFRAGRALRSDERFVVECDCCSFPYFGIKTMDEKGHIPWLTEYSRDERWTAPFPHRDWEINYASHGGTRIEGTFTATDEHGMEISVPFKGRVSLTKSEVEAVARNEADSEKVERFQTAMDWIQEDAMDDYREAVWEAQQECDHDRTHLIDGPGLECPNADGYCEDCGAEVTAEGELAW